MRGALVRSLEISRIKGVDPDLYGNEPEIEKGLFNLDNVVLTPCLGSATAEVRAEISFMAAQNMLAALREKKPNHCVKDKRCIDPYSI